MLTDQAEERRRRRGLALRISTLLAGVLNLALAAVLIALPGSSTSFDPLPTPGAGTETREKARGDTRTGRPVAATSLRSAPAPVAPTTSAAPSPPSQAAPRPSRSPVRKTGAVPPSAGVREASKPDPAISPSAGQGTQAARPGRTPAAAVAPSPASVTPSRTRQPPGRVRGDGPAGSQGDSE
ncbi:hypothetical protein FXF51_27685 [Nonomuraea sp. PA05]|uniref:hypothetical protein n=1 Tax=Nonomuraea sp. PA05 TaxID=2604466 RepID=UPI0011DA2AED|nr:hypothetical protein [Nonomuraea sp. PA05]TYB61853.1 hypothetical protein FXF51_27685 [Nonomuraea sp. PA05]